MNVRIAKTFLSTKPGKLAFWIALWSGLVLTIVALAYWDDLPSGIAVWLPASRQLVFGKHQYWRLFTTIGVHADFKHLGSNLVLFVILSYLLSGYFGLFVYPMLTLALGAVAMGATLAFYKPDVELIGASGVVYLMAGFWLAMYVLIERSLSVGHRLLRAVGFSLILLVPEVFDPSVSYLAHAIGFEIGFAAAIPIFFARRSWFRSFDVIATENDAPEGGVRCRARRW